ncbi:MAG: autotransporter assembly complex protein TamA [Gammaproteobacteria bacterium]|nr:autotransporter assembly complex protein TamA [Gammaproteobacteria bacterium]
MSTIVQYLTGRRRRAVVLLACLLLPSAAVADLQIRGVDDELSRNIRNYVTLATEPCNAEQWRVRRRFRTIEAEARSALEPFGYYSPVIQSSLERDDDCWRATLYIDAGRPVNLRNVDIAVSGPAIDDPAFAEFISPRPLTAGAQLRHSDYERLKKSLQVRAAERGYLEAEFTENSIDVWPDEFAADVSLNFASGPRYDFGEIRQDQAFLDPALVIAHLEFDSGTAYDSQLLARAYSDLSASGYFRRIELLPETEQAQNNQVPIRLQLEPADRIEYTVGAGFSTDTGPRLRAGYHNRRVNTKGHRFNINTSIASVIQGITAEYRKPLADPRSEWMSYTAALTFEDTDTFESDAARFGIRRSKKLRPEWIRTLSVDVNYDRFDIGGETGTSTMVLPAIAFDHRRSDRQVFPTRGRRFGFEVRGSGRSIGSDTTFIQASVWARWVRSITDDSRLLARASFGVTSKSEFDDLPPSVRFFAGGDESVRGFGYNTLGPEDDEGNVIGGSNLLIASIEYEHRLRGNWYGAAFVDAGNAFDGSEVDAAVGAGLGVKWLSPVGPLRFYLAHPLNKVDRSVRLHVRLGADL